MNPADFEEVVHRLGEHVGILDREGNLSWSNELLATRLGLVPGTQAEALPPVRWVASGSIPALMRSLIAVETGLTPPGERIALQLVLKLPGKRTVELISSIQRLSSPPGRVLLLARRLEDRPVEGDGLLPSQADFLANMSHELRTPLNSIIGYADLLSLEDFEASPEQRSRYVRDIGDSGRHLLELIDDILEFAKVGAGRMTLRVESVDVLAELDGCVKVAEGLAIGSEHPIDFSLVVEGSVGSIQTDLRLFKQVVVNLLSNALKFSPQGGHVELAVRRVGIWLQVAVRDQGIGIDPEHAELIFSPFVQLDSGTSRQRGGMGLGLAIVRRFLELLGGGIRLRSRLGVGSTFTFHIPADARSISRDSKGRPLTAMEELPALEPSDIDIQGV